MPANLYGVAAPNPLPAFGTTVGGGNVTINPGVETNALVFTQNPPVSSGWYYLAIFGSISFFVNSPAATFVNLGLRIGAGADLGVVSLQANTLTANGYIAQPLAIMSVPNVFTTPVPAGLVYVTATAGTNMITVLQFGSYMWGGWFRAPDQ